MRILENSFNKIIQGVSDGPDLSRRVLVILHRLAQGASQGDVAKELNLSIETIKKDLDAARKVLGASTTTHAVSIAMNRKLINLSGYLNM